MRATSFILTLALALLIGCSKPAANESAAGNSTGSSPEPVTATQEKSPARPVVSSPATAPVAAPVPSTIAGSNSAEQQRQTLLNLTAALHRWLQDQPDIPQTFDLQVLVRTGHLKAIPPPPAGLRYVVNPKNLQVELSP